MSTRHLKHGLRIIFAVASGFFLLVFAHQDANAMPACPEPVKMQQPNGQNIQVYLRGDEFLHWNEDVNGFTILKDSKTASWVYAAKDVAGNLVPSAAVVGRDDPRQVGISQRLLPDGAVAKSKVQRSARSQVFSEDGGPVKLPPTGTMKNLVLLVEFADKPHSRTKAEFEELFNTIGYTTDGAAGSVKDYYKEVSYNALSVESTVVDWITLDNGYAYYGADSAGNDIRPREMVAEALAKLEASGLISPRWTQIATAGLMG